MCPEVGDRKLTLKNGGSWEVGPASRWELESRPLKLVGDGEGETPAIPPQ